LKRKRFIKIMQSKGLQRNEAEKLAKELHKYVSDRVSYELVSRGTVTRYFRNCFTIKYSNHDAILMGTIIKKSPMYCRSEESGLAIDCINLPHESTINKYWLKAPFSESQLNMTSLHGNAPRPSDFEKLFPFCI